MINKLMLKIGKWLISKFDDTTYNYTILFTPYSKEEQSAHRYTFTNEKRARSYYTAWCKYGENVVNPSDSILVKYEVIDQHTFTPEPGKIYDSGPHHDVPSLPHWYYDIKNNMYAFVSHKQIVIHEVIDEPDQKGLLPTNQYTCTDGETLVTEFIWMNPENIIPLDATITLGKDWKITGFPFTAF